jgi:hypothetical protein
LFNAFKYGLLKVNSNLKFLILLLAINLACAVVLTGPVYLLLNESLTRNMQAAKLVQSFDFQWFIEFEYKFHDSLKFIPIILILVGSAFALIQVFLTGGILEIFNSKEERNSFIDFFYGCVRYFFRFFVIFLIAVICYACLYYLNLAYIRYIDYLTYKTEAQFTIIIANSLRYIIIAFLFGSLNIIFDYTKISIVVNQSYKIFTELWMSFKFIIKNFLTVSALFWLVAAIGLSVFLTYGFIDNFLNPNTFLLVLLLFFIRQIYITGRIWVRLLFYSCQTELYREITAPIIPVEASEIQFPMKGE